ncbi:MAG: Xylulose kinase [Phycisphaerae bacterium]|nr:Xylulose kinase [Phycisphaerae bacterium]
MSRYALGIDVGTGGSRALLLSDEGRVVATASAAHELLSPRPGWTEQRPADWWTSACAAVRQVLRRAKLAAKAVAGVGLSGQMHGSVFLDQRRRPLCNALLWNDQRTVAQCREIEEAAGGRAALIGLVLNPAQTGYQAPKIAWLRTARPRLFAQVRHVLLPKDYICMCLTERVGSDVSDASGTLLFDVQHRRWSTELMERLRFDPAWFGPAVESQDVVGQITPAAAAETGLAVGTPVVAGAGDQAASAVGSGVIRAGVVSATIGTSGVVFAHCDAPTPNDAGLFQSFCHAAPGAWCVFGCMLSAGGSLQWARSVLAADELRRARRPEQRDALYRALIAEATKGDEESTQGVPVFLPYLSGERCPYPHPHARGAWIGLRADHRRGDLVRAVLDGITLGMGQQIELMRAAGLSVREVRLAGGGARSGWWRQLQADVYGCRCARMATEEGSAMGAAILGGVGGGAFASIAAACRRACRRAETLRPRRGRTAWYRQRAELARRFYAEIEPLYRLGPA